MIDYEEEWFLRLLAKKKGSVIPTATLWAIPSIVIAVILCYLDEFFPGAREDWGMYDANRSQLWAATTSTAIFMLVFRTRQAFSRFWEGTGLLHQMRGEWFDTVSNCVTFSIAAKPTKPFEVMAFRHCIIRIMSLCHGSALEEISGNNIQLESIDTFGLDDKTLNHLQECHIEYDFNKVEVMLHLLQSLITKALHDGVLQIPPPIASRVYQTISRGFVNLLNAKKIQDTKFPFPYAQLISFLMVVLSLLTPSLMTVIVHSKMLAVVFTFMPMFGLYCLNFVAMELENPFGTDDNDLPLEHFQTEMNNCLMMLLHPNTDLIATVSDRCEMDFQVLRRQVCVSIKDAEEKAKEVEWLSNSMDRPARKKTRRLSEFDINNPDVSRKSETFQDDGEDALQYPPPRESTNSKRTDTSEKEPDMSATPTPPDSARLPQLQVAKAMPKASAPNAAVDAAKVALEMENLSFFVGKEPVSGERRSPRMQEPLPMINVAPPESGFPPELGPADGGSPAAPFTGPGSRQRSSSNTSRGSDFQPLLAKNLDDVIVSLEDWTKNVYREVDALTANSAVLQKALKKFNEGLPGLKAQAAAVRGEPSAVRRR